MFRLLSFWTVLLLYVSVHAKIMAERVAHRGPSHNELAFHQRNGYHKLLKFC